MFFIGQRPASSNEFSDILGAQGFKPSSEQQKETLKQLTQQSAREEDDPIKRKVSLFSFYSGVFKGLLLTWLQLLPFEQTSGIPCLVCLKFEIIHI